MKKLKKQLVDSYDEKGVGEGRILAYSGESDELMNAAQPDATYVTEPFAAGGIDLQFILSDSDTLSSQTQVAQANQQEMDRIHEDARNEWDKSILWGVVGGAAGGVNGAAFGGVVNGTKGAYDNCVGSNCHLPELK